MKKIIIKPLNKIVIVFMTVCPVTTIYAYDAIGEGHRATQRYMEQHSQSQERVKAIQAQRDYDRQQRDIENKRQMQITRQRNSNNKPVSQAQMQKSINDLAEMITSDQARESMDYLNNLKPDPYVLEPKDPVNMEGFDTELKGQNSNFQYKFGN